MEEEKKNNFILYNKSFVTPTFLAFSPGICINMWTVGLWYSLIRRRADHSAFLHKCSQSAATWFVEFDFIWILQWISAHHLLQILISTRHLIRKLEPTKRKFQIIFRKDKFSNKFSIFGKEYLWIWLNFLFALSGNKQVIKNDFPMEYLLTKSNDPNITRRNKP